MPSSSLSLSLTHTHTLTHTEWHTKQLNTHTHMHTHTHTDTHTYWDTRCNSLLMPLLEAELTHTGCCHCQLELLSFPSQSNMRAKTNRTQHTVKIKRIVSVYTNHSMKLTLTLKATTDFYLAHITTKGRRWAWAGSCSPLLARWGRGCSYCLYCDL